MRKVVSPVGGKRLSKSWWYFLVFYKDPFLPCKIIVKQEVEICYWEAGPLPPAELTAEGVKPKPNQPRTSQCGPEGPDTLGSSLVLLPWLTWRPVNTQGGALIVAVCPGQDQSKSRGLPPTAAHQISEVTWHGQSLGDAWEPASFRLMLILTYAYFKLIQIKSVLCVVFPLNHIEV